MSCIEEAVGRKIAWPKSKVVTEKADVVNSPCNPSATVASSHFKAKTAPQVP